MNRDSQRRPHYVYELLRTSQGAGPTRYIGVRTAPDGDPETDEYWGSSEKIQKERDAGATFSKRVLATFETREDAEFFEAELHWQHMVGKDPHFYNVTAQLIEGKVGLLFPRERYISPEGEHLWFKEGSEPEGWRHDPAQWAQFRIPDHSDKLNQFGGFPQTYLGLELPEWEFNKFYPAELAFAVTQPRHCHEPYVKLDYRNDILDCYYFPIGGQPNGWVRGFAPNPQIGSNVPDGWRAYFHICPLTATSAYFPIGETPRGWVDAETLSDMHKSRLTEGLTSNTAEGAGAGASLASRAKAVVQKQRAVTPSEAIDGHVADMLAEATRLHKEAMARLDKPKADPLPQLRAAMSLLEQAEILASDAASYVDADELDGALAELYRQQGEVRAMIGQVEARRVSPPQANTIPLILIALFALAALCVWVSV